MAERSRPVVDTLIAATARVNNKIIVTRNVADFADAGVTVLDPWAHHALNRSGTRIAGKFRRTTADTRHQGT